MKRFFYISPTVLPWLFLYAVWFFWVTIGNALIYPVRSVTWLECCWTKRLKLGAYRWSATYRFVMMIASIVTIGWVAARDGTVSHMAGALCFYLGNALYPLEPSLTNNNETHLFHC